MSGLLTKTLLIFAVALAVPQGHAVPAGCRAPKALGSWIGGRGDEVYNEVNSIEVLEDAKNSQALGWFYTLKDRSVYFQPAFEYASRVGQGGRVTRFLRATEGSAAMSVRVRSQTVSAAIWAMRGVVSVWHVQNSNVPEPFRRFVRGQRAATKLIHCS